MVHTYGYREKANSKSLNKVKELNVHFWNITYNYIKVYQHKRRAPNFDLVITSRERERDFGFFEK